MCPIIATYEAREGIRLDPAKTAKNSGLRQRAKMMLNSMWGKFGPLKMSLILPLEFTLLFNKVIK